MQTEKVRKIMAKYGFALKDKEKWTRLKGKLQK
jgi:hypothetical protein